MQRRNVGSTHRRWTCVAFIFASAVLIFVTTPNAAAQSTIQNLQCNGILHGIVSDQQGRPAPGIKVDAWPLGVDLGMVLPEATTDEAGEYRFDHLCPGTYTVVPDDEFSPYQFEFLYARRLPEAKLTDKELGGEISVQLPPSPGKLDLQVGNRATNQRITTFTAEVRVPGQRHLPWIKYDFDDRTSECEVAVPPDRNFVLHIRSDGFHTWTAKIAGQKLLRVTAGEKQTLGVQLIPISKR